MVLHAAAAEMLQRQEELAKQLGHQALWKAPLRAQMARVGHETIIKAYCKPVIEAKI